MWWWKDLWHHLSTGCINSFPSVYKEFRGKLDKESLHSLLIKERLRQKSSMGKRRDFKNLSFSSLAVATSIGL